MDFLYNFARDEESSMFMLRTFTFLFFLMVLSSLQAQRVVINELVASNDSTSMINDEYGEYDDWVELYNMESYELDLGGYFISDDFEHKDKWEIPEGTLIKGNGYLIIWLDKDENNMQKPLHTNFKLEKEGEELALTQPNMVTVDSVRFGRQTTNVSLARSPDGTGSFKQRRPTFKANNDIAGKVSDNPVDLGFKLYPNPTMGTTSIEFKEYLSVSRLTLSVVNVVGRVLKTESHDNFAGTRVVLSTKDLKDGFYFLEVKSPKQKRTQRLVVRHFRP